MVDRAGSTAVGLVEEFVQRAVLGRLRHPDAVGLFAPPSDDAALAAARREEQRLRVVRVARRPTAYGLA